MSYGNEMSPADVAAVVRNNDGNNNNGYGAWGGDWASWIILFLIFGMFGWGNGFGGFGNGFGGNGGLNGVLTRADLCQDMNFGQVQDGIRGIQQGICDSTFALNNTITNGFHGVDNAVCNLGFTTQQGFNATQVAMMQGQNALQAQIADCCCGVQRAIDGINYNMATNTCALQNTMNNNTRDIIDNQNAGTRAILDYLCQDKISTLQQENQTLRLAASQSNQNAVLMAAMDANKAEILRRTGAECPTAAYIVQPPTPVTFPTNCCGQATFANNGGCNSGCNNGCGNCF